MENNNLDWLNIKGDYSYKGYDLKFNKDFYDMLGIINVTIPVGDNKNYKLLISQLQENYINEKLYFKIKKDGQIFLNAIKSIGVDEEECKKVRPRNESFIMYNNIRLDEEPYWKKFLDELNVEYKIEEYGKCWWNDKTLPNYKSVWVNEDQFKSIENSKEYIKALKNLHDSIEKHLIVRGKSEGDEVDSRSKDFWNSYLKRLSRIKECESLHNDIEKELKYMGNDCESLEDKKKRQEAFESGMKKLDSLVGLTEIKSLLKETIARVSANQRAKKIGINVDDEISNHMIFIGNPGTGKTEVARILSEIYYGLGVLETNTFVETNKAELIGEHAGETEKNVKAIFQQVIEDGGMLFIDEFHQFFDGEISNGFGYDALESMIPYIENSRDKFVLVVAGYPEKMAKALKYDPGLEQRFSVIINFLDYSKIEVLQIFKNLCNQNNTNINVNNCKDITDIFTSLPDGGNGRMARDIYENSLSKQALRIFEMGNISDEQFKKEYSNITVEDIKKSINTIISKYSKNNKKETKTIEFI